MSCKVQPRELMLSIIHNVKLTSYKRNYIQLNFITDLIPNCIYKLIVYSPLNFHLQIHIRLDQLVKLQVQYINGTI